MTKRIKDEELKKISGGDHWPLPYRDRLDVARSDVPASNGNEIKTGDESSSF